MVKNQSPNATIVIAANPSPAAELAAWELQYHIKKITDVEIPVVDDKKEVSGNRILIGESRFTKALNFDASALAPQEYWVDFKDNNLVLLGRDWYETAETEQEKGVSIIQVPLEDTRVLINYNNNRLLKLPGIYDEQASLYATYDFIEKALGVRWYGPSEFNVVTPQSKELVIPAVGWRRSPDMKYRDGTGLEGPMISLQYGNPSKDAIELFHRRMRRGGEKWGANHSLSSFQDRFLQKNPDAPELFEYKREDYFAVGRTGNKDERQFCYTNQGLIDQLVKDARNYFDGKGVKGAQIAIGDYFAVLPLDNDRWCLCTTCQTALSREKSKFNQQHFSYGIASNYIFSFINSIADSIAVSHPGKMIATLAYHVYSYFPDSVKLRSNVSVSPCLHTRQYMAPALKSQEWSWYKKWIERSKAPLYVWNYHTFPTERGIFGFGAVDGKTPWNVFPGFSAHAQAASISEFHKDGVRGVFLCGVGEQLDYYLAMKQYDDSTLRVDDLMQEFFNLYFGEAALPMQAFYQKIESVYNDFARYPDRVKGEQHHHQDEEIAWRYLGTEEVMKELENYVQEALAAKLSPIERERVISWERGIWDYMKTGRNNYLISTKKN
jgi:hypothetical protein